jgi:xylulose-5-phosphate/fructose-6-phosphate phosphoketolase
MLNQIDEFVQKFEANLQEHHAYICTHLDDMPEIKNWKWSE